MAGALAMHCLRGHLLPQAVQYLGEAGQQAAQRGAHPEAVAFYEQALEALQQLPTTPDRLAQAIDLHLALDRALFACGVFHRSFAILREAERLAEALGDQRRLGWVTETLSVSFRRIGTYDQAVALAQRAATLAGLLGDGALQVRSTLRLGQVYYARGDYRRAIACFQDVVASSPAHATGTRDAVFRPAQARSWLVCCLAERGEFGAGLTVGAEAVRIAEAGDIPMERCAAYNSLGYLSLVRGAFQPAIALLARGLDLCRRWHNLDWFPECAGSLGLAYALTGRLADALPLLEQAVKQEATMGGGNGAVFLTRLSHGYLVAGRLEEARTHVEGALVLARERREHGIEAYTLRILGEIATRSDPPEVEHAVVHYQQALALAEALGMRPLQAHCHRGLGLLYATTGQRQQARPALGTAMALYRSMDMTFWLPETEAALS
jgi:tetratricopeptide (TPR) repeat protein